MFILASATKDNIGKKKFILFLNAYLWRPCLTNKCIYWVNEFIEKEIKKNVNKKESMF